MSERRYFEVWYQNQDGTMKDTCEFGSLPFDDCCDWIEANEYQIVDVDYYARRIIISYNWGMR